MLILECLFCWFRKLHERFYRGTIGDLESSHCETDIGLSSRGIEGSSVVYCYFKRVRIGSPVHSQCILVCVVTSCPFLQMAIESQRGYVMDRDSAYKEQPQETGPAVTGGFQAALGEGRGKSARTFESPLGCQLHCFIPVQAILPRFGTGGP
jgi:hypothetical protein